MTPSTDVEQVAFELSPKRLRLVTTSDDFERLLMTEPGGMGPWCSCQAAIETGLSEPAVRSILTSRAYVAVLSSQVVDFRNRRATAIEPTNPDTQEQLLFVKPELLQTPERLANHTHVLRLEMLSRVVRRWFDAYQIGPPLGSQTGSRKVRRRLTRGVWFLRDVGLVESTMIGENHYPHVASFLFPAGALGFLDVREDRLEQLTADFFENPAAFLAWALVNSLGLEDRRANRAFDELHRGLWAISQGAVPKDVEPIARQHVALSASWRTRFLDGLVNRYAELARLAAALETRVEAWRTSDATRVRAEGRGGEVEMQTGQRDDPPANGAALAAEVSVYRERLDELVAKHEGEFVLIFKRKIRGIFSSATEALRFGHREFGYVPMLVREVTREQRPLGASSLDL